MAKISEYKVLTITFENEEEHSVYITEDPKDSYVLIAGRKILIKDLKEIVGAFTDRYPFVFAEEIASSETKAESTEED